MKTTFQLNNFDLIRIGTALLVLVNHSLQHLQLHTPAWFTVVQKFHGVPMFFAISGFLLSASLERNGQMRHYFTNRAMRIYPGLWTCLLLTVVLFTMFGGVNFANPQTLPWMLAQVVGLIYTPGFLNDFGYGSYNGSLWTICVELQFYFILPVLYFLYRKFGNIVFYLSFIAAALVALAIKVFPTPGIEKLLRYSFLPHVYIFLAGVVLQRLQVWKWSIVKGKAIHWIIFYLLLNYTLPQVAISDIVLKILLAVTTIAMAYTLTSAASKLLKGTDISYGVYIYHGMLLTLLVELGIIGTTGAFIFVLIASCVLAWLSFKFIEHPAMRKAKSLNQNKNEVLIRIPSILSFMRR